ncbi:DNA internalization-related competence protein ComEC/Rec2 [Ruminiclostridium cellulolyticum]|uniref:DNA internalization-related competence protein ComEC/Rec2 n=1 Tax=Ruminiclostridium cellulolyticum (strain ATCC 35319 / DSM 5812 / JCM 6584 / H10) TaxID=394503 RepID=B8I3G0_RUMCH|nr:DNA internalization-related competence protein ComEC/Rec2 [Ruminiclostridium cellulolyticum]ACL76303.1 DNA internalization-related competence protein ComEC/Rec2 [Ruminiclostridium cellulolyticum H10]
MNIKRPLCLFVVSFILGILIVNAIGLNQFLIVSAVILLAITCLLKKLGNYKIIIFVSLTFVIAGGMFLYYAEYRYSGSFDQFYGKLVEMKGYVDSEVQNSKNSKSTFVFKTESVIYKNKTFKVNNSILVYVNNLTPEIGYRTKISFTGVVEKPKPATNPGGFNYRRYLASIGISGRIYLYEASDIHISGQKGGGYANRLGYVIKNKVIEIVSYSLDKNQAGLLEGMLIGYKDGLDENAFKAFSKAGLTHIMVASGMNVAFIILPFAFIFKKLRMSNLSANLITIFILVLFVFVTGFSASVVRAVIMGIIILVGRIIMREPDIYTSISAAALILLAINPYTLFDIGFQLSFGATLSLVMFYQQIKTFIDSKYIPGVISDTLAATLAAQLGVVPVTLYYFNNFSTFSILSNILVVPLVEVVTIIGFIMVFAGLLNINLAVIIGYINNTFLSFILFVTEVTSKIPFSLLKLPTPTFGMVLFYYLLLIYIFKARSYCKDKKYIKHITIAIVVSAIIISGVRALLPEPLEITFLDVGQGDSTFIRTAHGTKVLIDGGGRASNSKSEFDIGESVMIPYILDKGTKRVDIVIASHGHSDHTEGLETVLREMAVGTVILPETDGRGLEKINTICREKNISVIKCKQGDRIRLDNETIFEVLNPLPYKIDSFAQEDLNESSLVLKLVYRNIKVLFTGDSGIQSEQRMIKQGLDLTANVIKVGHHGSPGSSGQEYIKKVQPYYAIVSVGRNNFGHPSQFAIDTLEGNGAKLLRTDEKGAIILTSYGDGFNVKTMLP